jgi:NAD(P)-dependent dehydrogenase (short-subunit alcohol dehydrogenase family)
MPIALITGAGGIGSATARSLKARGWHVVMLGRDDSKNLASGADLSVIGDATSSDSLESAVDQTVNRFGRLDGLVHAVGSLVLKPVHLTKEEEFQETLRVNLVSAFRALKAALKPMQAQSAGSVVLVSSVAAMTGLPNHEAIAAAKGGVAAMAASAAATYASKGIRVNCVAPGLVRTPMTARIFASEASLNASRSLHPMGRTGEPEDIANLIAFLLSDESSWITGGHFPADGGMVNLRNSR